MQKNKLYHVLSYIPFLFLISYLIDDKNNPAVTFHRRQGIVLTIFSAASGIIVRLFALIFGWIPLLGAIAVLILTLALSVAVLALMFIGIVRAIRDEEIPLPFIGQFANRF